MKNIDKQINIAKFCKILKHSHMTDIPWDNTDGPKKDPNQLLYYSTRKLSENIKKLEFSISHTYKKIEI